jgi:hypothetical protein
MHVVLSIFIATIFSTALYFGNKNLEISKMWKVALATFRFLSVFIICFILFSPLVKMKVKTVEKPQLFVALDCSKSMRTGDTAEIFSDLKKITNSLEEKFNIREFSFGKNVSQNFVNNFNDNATDFSALFDKISMLRNNEISSAVVLLTDGNYNYGASPLYSYQNVSLPLYAVAFGDTATYPDVSVARVSNNKYAYLNNFFPIEVSIDVRNIESAKISAAVYHDGTKIEEKSFENNMSLQFDIKADKAGLQAYTVRVSSVIGEKNITNNSKTFYIDVLDGKQKVLILAAAPHPDISAIRQAVENGDISETSLFVGKEIPQNIDEYNLVFLHGLPSAMYPVKNLMAVLKEKSLFVIINETTDLNALKLLNIGFDITLKSNSFSEAVAEKNNAFGLFSVSKEDEDIIKNLPPLAVPFGAYKTSPSGETFLYQKIMNISSENPLLWFSVSGGRGVGVLAGSGIYRWRLNNYLLKQNTTAFDELIAKSVQMLANRANKEPLVIRHPKYFYEQTSALFDAELYNTLFEPIENEKISISISDSSGKKYEYDFSPQGKFYHLNAGYLPSGKYRYTASAKTGNKTVEKSGMFSIVPLQLEDATLPVNIAFLKDITSRYDGRTFLGSSNWSEELLNELESRPDMKPQIRYEEKSYSLIGRWWIWLILVVLLGGEWFVRKYHGKV